MSRLFDDIQAAVYNGNYLVSWHADDRCEEPNPSVVVLRLPPGGTTEPVTLQIAARLTIRISLDKSHVFCYLLQSKPHRGFHVIVPPE